MVFLAKAITFIIVLQVILLCGCSVNIGINDLSGTSDSSKTSTSSPISKEEQILPKNIQFKEAE